VEKVGVEDEAGLVGGEPPLGHDHRPRVAITV
jgi:hypothetical protein